MKKNRQEGVHETEYSSRKNIINIIWRNNHITRTEISNKTGLTLAAISKIISKLIKDEIVIESKFVKGKNGRRSIGLIVNKEKFHIIGVRLSRNFFRICTIDFFGNILKYEEHFLTKNDNASILKLLINKINYFVNNDKKIIAVGIAVPGPYNLIEGRIEHISSLPDFYHIDIKTIFQSNIKVSTYIIQDAQAAAFYCNYKTNINELVYYFLDEGVGAGVISKGRVLEGNSGTASEIGHISVNNFGDKCSCGNYGCLELYCSSISFVNNFKKSFNNQNNKYITNENITLKSIFDAARKGDDFSLEKVKELAEFIGFGAVNIVHAYNPKLIIFGGNIMGGHDLLKNEILKTMDKRLIDNLFNNIMFDFLDNTEDLVLMGSATKAIEETIQKSIKF